MNGRLANCLELSKIPRLWREAARRKRAGHYSFSRSRAGQARRTIRQPAGSAEGPAKGPALSVGVISQGFSELFGGARGRIR